MRKQHKRMGIMVLVLILSLVGFAANADPVEKGFTIDEKDIHRPVFVVDVDESGVETVRGAHTIYRIFFEIPHDPRKVDESTNPVLNLWTDEKGSKRVSP